MRFIDTNVFIHAILEIKREDKSIEETKRMARTIINRINSGERALTTVVHLSEFSNVMENYLNIEHLADIISKLLRHDNLIVEEVSKEEYMLSADYAKEFHIGINDALAVVKMEKYNINEIYSFDKDFDMTDKKRLVR